MTKGGRVVAKVFEWRSVTSHVLFEHPYELVPEDGTQRWFVVHSRDRLVALTDALPFDKAKRAAERLVRRG